jgi:hypothetical protein
VFYTLVLGARQRRIGGISAGGTLVVRFGAYRSSTWQPVKRYESGFKGAIQHGTSFGEAHQVGGQTEKYRYLVHEY